MNDLSYPHYTNIEDFGTQLLRDPMMGAAPCSIRLRSCICMADVFEVTVEAFEMTPGHDRDSALARCEQARAAWAVDEREEKMRMEVVE